MFTLFKGMVWLMASPFILVAKVFKARAIMRAGKRTKRVRVVNPAQPSTVTVQVTARAFPASTLPPPPDLP